MSARPSIPADIRRSVSMEAGHRCAIPTCKATPIELAHIVPWAQCKEHKSENLIALCPTCHTRYDNGDIDRKSMLAYKHNLSIVNSRYGELEKRLLRLFADDPTAQQVLLPGGQEIHLLYMLQDGLLAKTGKTSGISLGGMPSQEMYQLTLKGRAFIDQWIGAEEIT